MKRIILACLFVFLVFGCDRDTDQDYADEVVETLDRTQEFADNMSLQAIQRNIRSYRALNGKYPESVEALATIAGYNFDPDKYEYDPDTGIISLK